MRKSFSAFGIVSALEAHEVEFWPQRAVEIEQERLRGGLPRGARILQWGADSDRDALSGSAPGAVIERGRKSEDFVAEPSAALRPVERQLAPPSGPIAQDVHPSRATVGLQQICRVSSLHHPLPGYAVLGENGLP